MEGLQRYVCINIKSLAGLPNGRLFYLTSPLTLSPEGEGG